MEREEVAEGSAKGFLGWRREGMEMLLFREEEVECFAEAPIETGSSILGRLREDAVAAFTADCPPLRLCRLVEAA